MSIAQKLTAERRSRLAAERLLELKQAELAAANRKLGQFTKQLKEEIVETRAEVETVRGENRRVRSDLTAANQKIALTERRLWHSIETIRDGFAFFDAANTMIMANRSYLQIFDGLELIRPGVNYVTLLQLMTDEGIVNTGDLTPSSWRQMMATRFELPRPEPIIIQLWNGRFVRLIDQRGPDGDVVSLGMDITAHIASEQKLEAARKAAESANRAKSAFLANMSHEIRTPMNGVVGMADVLGDTTLDDDQRLCVETIRNSAQALLVIINDVLDYSKIEAGRLDLHPEEFDLERAIQEVLMLLQPTARKKGLNLLLDYDLFLPARLIGDPGRLRQVLTNLIGNAVKFTNTGYVLVRVTGIPGRRADFTQLHIAVEDSGIGIPQSQLDQVFGEFNQVDSSQHRAFEGTGLGLAITRRLVELMQGEIWVTSEEGHGSCFGFRLPMAMPAGHSDRNPQLPASIKRVAIHFSDARERSVLEYHFRQLGAVVLTADGFGSQQPDGSSNLICVDLDLCRQGREAFLDWLPRFADEQFLFLFGEEKDRKLLPKDVLAKAVLLGKPVQRWQVMQEIRRLPLDLQKPETGHDHSALRPMRILAVDDNKTNQLVFRKMIRDLQITLDLASNGEEAVARFRAEQPDLIFMDISMPIMDGREATREIRNLENRAGQAPVPIIALTAHAMDGDAAAILAAGLTGYLAKPLRKAEILKQVLSAHHAGLLPLDPHSQSQSVG